MDSGSPDNGTDDSGNGGTGVLFGGGDMRGGSRKGNWTSKDGRRHYTGRMGRKPGTILAYAGVVPYTVSLPGEGLHALGAGSFMRVNHLG
jgi:hypothetical protein